MYVYFMNGKFQCAFLQNGSRIMIGAPGAFYWQGNLSTFHSVQIAAIDNLVFTQWIMLVKKKTQ